MGHMEQIVCFPLPLHPPRVDGPNGLVRCEIPFRYLERKKKKRKNVSCFAIVRKLSKGGLSTHLSSDFLPFCFALPVFLQYSLPFVCTSIPFVAFHVLQNRFETFPSRK